MLITEIRGILALSDEGEDFSSMKDESTVNKNILTSKLPKMPPGSRTSSINRIYQFRYADHENNISPFGLFLEYVSFQIQVKVDGFRIEAGNNGGGILSSSPCSLHAV